MSVSKNKTGAAPVEQSTSNALTDEAVRQFLKDNGDFLERNPDLLDHLHVSHASGSAVSLVEKQISVLRERNVDIRHSLKTLTRNARENDKLFEQTRALVVKLLEAESVAELYEVFMSSMQDNFEVEFASMILFDNPGGAGACRVDSLENAKSHIGALLSGRKPICGALRREEFNYLFNPAGSGQQFQQGGSAAIMTLNDGTLRGLIAVGSSDATRYASDMGVLFLSHIAEVILRLTPRLSRTAD
ncbi:MAG: DUF484 family protein [Pseudomonadales bacterium]|nr:DUF484 family protein [Pseudomonadales bacterium]